MLSSPTGLLPCLQPSACHSVPGCAHRGASLGCASREQAAPKVLPCSPLSAPPAPQQRPHDACVHVRFYSIGPSQETGLVPAIRDTGFPTPLAVRVGATSSRSGDAALQQTGSRSPGSHSGHPFTNAPGKTSGPSERSCSHTVSGPILHPCIWCTISRDMGINRQIVLVAPFVVRGGHLPDLARQQGHAAARYRAAHHHLSTRLKQSHHHHHHHHHHHVHDHYIWYMRLMSQGASSCRCGQIQPHPAHQPACHDITSFPCLCSHRQSRGGRTAIPPIQVPAVAH